jgi:hypothetical protein
MTLTLTAVAHPVPRVPATVRTAVTVPLRSADGDATTARIVTFDGLADGREHLALALGDWEGAGPQRRRRLVSHLGRKVEFAVDGQTSTADIGGATAQVVVGDGLLVLRAVGDDEEAVARVEHVLDSHLERFAARSELTVSWTRTPEEGPR